MKILIVEDNDVNRVLLRDVLALLEAEIHEAAGGQEAIALSRALRPDLILMDVQLPGLDGIEATRILKADPETMDIPVVAISSYAFEREKKSFLEAGGSGYITKPIDLEEVFRVVKEFAGEKRSEG